MHKFTRIQLSYQVNGIKNLIKLFNKDYGSCKNKKRKKERNLIKKFKNFLEKMKNEIN